MTCVMLEGDFDSMVKRNQYSFIEALVEEGKFELHLANVFRFI